MPHMIYLKDIHPESMVLFTATDESFRLRDYSVAGASKPLIVLQQGPSWTASKIKEEAQKPGNRCFPVEEHDVNDYFYWHQKTHEFNGQFLPQTGQQKEASTKWTAWLLGAIGTIIVTVAGGLALAFAKNWFGLSDK